MKTTIEEHTKLVRFASLKVGDMFKDTNESGCIAMKTCSFMITSSSMSKSRNAVIIVPGTRNGAIASGEISRWEDDEMVLPVAEVVVRL